MLKPNDYNFILEIDANIKRSEVSPPISHLNYPINDECLSEQVTLTLLHQIHLGQIAGPYNLNNLPYFNYRI